MKQRLSITIGLVSVLLASLLIIKDISTKEEPVTEDDNPPVEEILPVEPLEEPELIIEEPEVEESPSLKEQMRATLVEKYGEDVVNAWEKLTVDPNFNFVGKRITVEEFYGPEGEVHYECYITTENGNEEWAGVGGNYYVYGIFISNEAIFDLVEYHNMFSIEI